MGIPATTKKILFLLASVGLVGLNGACAGESRSVSLEVIQGDSIVFIGNTFAERLHLFGYFETLLHSKYPDHRLKIRNMGWSGDEVALRPRPFRFGDMHRYLTEQEVDVIFACFGMNESFGGAEGLPQFQADLDALVEDLRTHRYNGASAPRIVLVSPIAHEDLGGHLPDGIEHNQSLRQYTEAMGDAAEAYGLAFVDLFTPTQELYSTTARKLTSNGIHLTAYGYWTVSQIMARSLGFVETIAAVNTAGNPAAESLRRAIYDKNHSFFFRWRAPNMEYIHGERRTLPGAELMTEELGQLAGIIEQLETNVWEMAKPGPEEVWQELPPDRPLWIDPPLYTDIDVPPITATEEPTAPRQEGPDRGILSVEDALKSFHLPDGYAINLYASEEEFPIANPMAMNFDAEGRLWVANTPTWPHPLPGRQPSDSIVILEDNDRDGVADEHTVFIDNLNMIHGFALGDGGAYISQTPNIIHAEDIDGDLQADRFRIVLQGFGGEDVEHSISNYKWGPDGALYFMEGIFFHTQVETPYGPRRVRNGGVFRYEPSTQRFDAIVSYAFWNPWGQVFDSWGQNIVLDASSHDYFNTSVLSANFVYPKEKENEHSKLSFAPRSLGPAAGINLIQGRHFPEEAQGRFLAGQLSGGFRGIRWYEISEDGTKYEVDQQIPELLRSTDPYFRPVATAFGPDGALYVADFSSPLIENTSEPKRDPGRDHGHGRIWRISYADGPLSTRVRVVGEPVPLLLGLLGASENTTRRFARRELQERGAEAVLPPLREWLGGLDSSDPDHERYLLEGLWIYQGLDVVEPDLLSRLLRADNPHARAAATRVLRWWQNRIDGAIDLLAEQVEDEDARVRLEAILASGFSDSDRARDVALQATKYPLDVGTKHALDETMDYFDRRRSGVDPTDPTEIELPAFPQGVAYVLSRLTNEQLVNIERTEPVYIEMLVHEDLDASLRRTAIVELAGIRGTSQLAELLEGIAGAERSEGRRRRALNDLVQILMMTPPADLARQRDALVALAEPVHVELSRRAAYAALLIADGPEAVWQLAGQSDAALLDLLAGVPLIPDPIARAALYPRVTSLIHDATNRDLRQAAIRASAFIPGHEEETFTLLAELVESGTDRAAAVEALRDLSATRWPKQRIGELADSVLDYLQTEAVERRGTPEFKRALQLGDELASLLPSERGREVREVLRGLGIRTVTIRAVPHLLLYDKPLIVVEAGEPVEITFEDPGVMNHNLVIVAPGKMEEIGWAADGLIGAPARQDGREFVPDSVEVLQATPLVEPHASATLTFVAPEVTGEYPYLCTVPGHWVRMNGIMLVVDDVDAWMAENASEVSSLQPTAAVFVRNWTTDDLVNDLDRLGAGRSFERGEQLFTGFCAPCHQVRGAGGVIGPDLSGSSTRLRPVEMLAEVIEPSKRIEAEYVTWTIELIDGRVVYGRVEDQDAATIRIVENPQLSSAATEIHRDQIERMMPSNLSTMPAGLLNTLTREQILDLLAYIRSERIP